MFNFIRKYIHHINNKLIHNKNKIVMFHSGRCGSTVVGNMLNKRPDTSWRSEIFEGYSQKENINNFNHSFDYLKYDIKNNKNYNYGFEIKFMPYQHLREDWIGENINTVVSKLINLRFNKFIILNRKNYLKRLTSQYVAKELNLWHTKKEPEKPTKIYINPEKIWIGNTSLTLIEYFKSLDSHYKELEQLLQHQECLHLTYEEDIETDPYIAYEKIVNFLNIDYLNVNIDLKKTNPYELNQVIENYSEIEDILTKADYKWMLQ